MTDKYFWKFRFAAEIRAMSNLVYFKFIMYPCMYVRMLSALASKTIVHQSRSWELWVPYVAFPSRNVESWAPVFGTET